MPNSSRRQKHGSKAPPLQTGSEDPIDEAFAAASLWLARHAEHEKLIRRWQRLETVLVRDHGWFELSPRARRELPEAVELDALNARIVDLYAQNQRRLARLRKLTSTTTRGLVSKLSVALATLQADDNREAHDLIRSILRDVERLRQTTE
jgi:hypothetical protein